MNILGGMKKLCLFFLFFFLFFFLGGGGWGHYEIGLFCWVFLYILGQFKVEYRMGIFLRPSKNLFFLHA